jgi:hypothetical protein
MKDYKYIRAFKAVSLLEQIILLMGFFFIFSILFTFGLTIFKFFLVLVVGFLLSLLITTGVMLIPLSISFVIYWLIKNK